MPYRWIYLGLALVGVAAIAAGIAFYTEGEGTELPGPLEAISPSPDELVPPQAQIMIDLEVGYQAVIFVDGWPIGDASFVEATGVYTWSPSPTSPNIQSWEPGEHMVRVEWDTYTGLPDTGSYEWSFRVG